MAPARWAPGLKWSPGQSGPRAQLDPLQAQSGPWAQVGPGQSGPRAPVGSEQAFEMLQMLGENKTVWVQF